MLDVFESLNFLKLNGLPVVKSLVVKSVGALKSACECFGYPLVLKVNSSGHKSDSGGVVISIYSYVGALKAFKQLKKYSSELVVQPQVSGLELSLGLKVDPVFGQVIMFGLGGVLIELLNDVSFRVCPVNKKEAKLMINELKSSKLLKGYRGQPKISLELLCDLIVKLSHLAVKDNIKVLDINPLIASADKLLIVDARLSL